MLTFCVQQSFLLLGSAGSFFPQRFPGEIALGSREPSMSTPTGVWLSVSLARSVSYLPWDVHDCPGELAELVL